jgi:APA family basic amino acid/polyamine antiporter
LAGRVALGPRARQVTRTYPILWKDETMSLFATKSIEKLKAEAAQTGEHSLKRVLGPINLITLGIGAIIGTGIFVLTGHAAADNTGPAIILAMVIAGFASALAGLCYSEFASAVPIAGSAYTYGYATLGEFFAWVIGWDLILEYALRCRHSGCRVVRSSGEFSARVSRHRHPRIRRLRAPWGDPRRRMQRGGDPQPPSGVDHGGGDHPHRHRDQGVGELQFCHRHGEGRGRAHCHRRRAAFINTANWHPFIPANTGTYGQYGWSGVFQSGRDLLRYIGFDAVSVAAQEAKEPSETCPSGFSARWSSAWFSTFSCPASWSAVLIPSVVRDDHADGRGHSLRRPPRGQRPSPWNDDARGARRDSGSEFGDVRDDDGPAAHFLLHG